MRHTPQLLSDYAAYHRDPRNIATHLVGVPLIVFAVCILLSRPALAWGGWAMSPAWAAFAASAAWYLTRGELALGATTSALIGAMVWAAAPLAAGSTGLWLGSGVGLFVVGWAIQFVGHHWEGRKPAFVDDLVGLLIGPMFVVAEVMFAAGWNPTLRTDVERLAGPTRRRDLKSAPG